MKREKYSSLLLKYKKQMFAQKQPRHMGKKKMNFLKKQIDEKFWRTPFLNMSFESCFMYIAHIFSKHFLMTTLGYTFIAKKDHFDQTNLITSIFMVLLLLHHSFVLHYTQK